MVRVYKEMQETLQNIAKHLKSLKNIEKHIKPKNNIIQLMSNKFSTWKNVAITRDEDMRINNLLANGLGLRLQKDLCNKWKENKLWCMTKYKPLGKKVRPVNQQVPQ